MDGFGWPSLMTQRTIYDFIQCLVSNLSSDWLTTVKYRRVSHVWRPQSEIWRQRTSLMTSHCYSRIPSTFLATAIIRCLHDDFSQIKGIAGTIELCKRFRKWHCNDVTMGAIASQITSLTLFTQPFVQTQIKENINTPRHWPLCRETSVTGEFSAQMTSNAENVFIWWRNHGQTSFEHGIYSLPLYCFRG